jgi:hypothetical protein
MKYLVALWLAVTAPFVYATCTYHTYCDAGRCVTCTTCCYGASCNTSCYWSTRESGCWLFD